MHPVYFMKEVYLLTRLVVRVDHKMVFRLEIELKSQFGPDCYVRCPTGVSLGPRVALIRSFNFCEPLIPTTGFFPAGTPWTQTA